jgi:AraC-like DNA-binding protein
MLKNKEIIENLSLDDKLSIIACGKNGGELNIEGVPQIKGVSLQKLNEQAGALYPADWALANSWNKDLFCTTAKLLAAYARGNGANVVYTSPVHVKSNVYSCGFSEDPYFVRAFIEKQVEGIKQAQVSPAITCLPITNGDCEYLTKTDKKVFCRTSFSLP